MIRDKIVFSIAPQEKALKERLLRQDNLTLAKTRDLCVAFEVTQNEVRTMSTHTTNDKSVNYVNKRRARPETRPPTQHSSGNRSYSSAKNEHGARVNKQQLCRCCGTKHDARRCPAYGVTCYKCNGRNHYSSVCKSKSMHAVTSKHREEDTGSSDDEFFLHAVTKCIESVQHDGSSSWFSYITVCESRIKMKVDTGSETNTMSMKTWKRIKEKPNLSNSYVILKTLGGGVVEHEGVAHVTYKAGGKSIDAELYITKQKCVPILGLEVSVALGLVQPGDNLVTSQGDEIPQIATVETSQPGITMNTLEEEYKDVFSGLGCYPGKYHIELNPGAQPVVDPPKRVPQALYEPLREKLKKLEEQGVIASVDEPTDWVNSLVITEKRDGSLRLCLDPKQLNKNIHREHFQIPTFTEVSTQLGGARLFTILDQKDSYWQVELDVESSKLCSFNTPFGRYRFVRMPFGITSASELLQKWTYKTFGDIPNVHIVADDMLIATKTEAEHDSTVRKVMERARSQGMKFNMKKTQLKKSEVFYMGTRISDDGMRPDEAKIKAIVNMPEPTDKDGVRRLVGMLNFLSPFIPNKAAIISSLCDLLKNNVPWLWLPEHKAAIDKVKLILSDKPVLKLYDPAIPVTIQADASSKGLGACLLQNSQPVAYASRALTDTESRYAQIERELLCIVFAAERFHQYIYGREVEVQSDHRPLETITRKPLHNASPRLQLMLLRLLRYKLSIRYVQGSKMYIADTLSRAFLSDAQPEHDMEMRVHSVSKYFPATPQKLQALREASLNDDVQNQIKRYVMIGWPKYKDNTAAQLHVYWGMRDEIHCEDDLLFAGERLIVPNAMRGEMLSRLHEGHLGTEKCRARARDIMYWPNMSTDIEETVARCATCATYRKRNNKQLMIPHEIPDRPWAKVGADIFSFKNQEYLVVVDYYSKFPEVEQLTCKTANGVISALRQIFSRHGIPEILFCDNMPFASHVMASFAEEMGFEIITSSPRYAQSNGQSEKFVGIVKSFMQSARGRTRHMDVSPALSEYSDHRSTVLTCTAANESEAKGQNAEYIEHTQAIRCS